jgi:hypothetical protein
MLCACLGVCLAFCAGCTTIDLQKIPPQNGIYPAQLTPDAPLVLAIPGLAFPGVRITQQQHFGRLVEMLAAEGIPCRIITYDTPEDPVSMKAALYSPELSIASTRVGPAIVRELEAENDRRTAHGIPPVKRLVLIGFSQGGVVMRQISRRIFVDFKKEYEAKVKEFGAEWGALQKDPEFQDWINSLDNFIALRNIRVQNEEPFKISLPVKRFYERVEKTLDTQLEKFLRYLVDPSSRYPGMKKFEGIKSPYYPKRYEKLREYAASRVLMSEAEKEKEKQFYITYAQYRALLDVEPYLIATAASLFGSPDANDAMNLMKWMPFVRRFIVGREYDQIQQNEVGTTQQLEQIETLAREYAEQGYPISPLQMIFIVGANGAAGDGIVDQPSAHLSGHSYTRVRVKDAHGGHPRFEEMERRTLPRRVVVPLRVMHFSEKRLWGLGGKKYGAAYMVKGNPAYPYILNFITRDWKAITSDLARNTGTLRQFMIEASFADAKMNRLSACRMGQSYNVTVTGRYYNSENGTIVWIGNFKELGFWEGLRERARLLDSTRIIPGINRMFEREGDAESLDMMTRLRERTQLLNPVPLVRRAGHSLGWRGAAGTAGPSQGKEIEGEVRIQVSLPGGEKVTLTCAVHPGCISFVRIDTGGAIEPITRTGS